MAKTGEITISEFRIEWNPPSVDALLSEELLAKLHSEHAQLTEQMITNLWTHVGNDGFAAVHTDDQGRHAVLTVREIWA